jgi:protein involved in temperature-dependent protein secretion
MTCELRVGEIAQAIPAAVQRAADRSRRALAPLRCSAMGEHDRAILQLDTLAQDPSSAWGQSSIARWCWRRMRCYARESLLPADSPAHVEARLEALRALREGRAADARSALERAERARPALEGKVDGEAFADLFDSDELLGPVLELFAGGHYLWLPLERVRTLQVHPPKHQLELLWLPRSRGRRATATVHCRRSTTGSAARVTTAARRR